MSSLLTFLFLIMVTMRLSALNMKGSISCGGEKTANLLQTDIDHTYSFTLGSTQAVTFATCDTPDLTLPISDSTLYLYDANQQRIGRCDGFGPDYPGEPCDYCDVHYERWTQILLSGTYYIAVTPFSSSTEWGWYTLKIESCTPATLAPTTSIPTAPTPISTNIPTTITPTRTPSFFPTTAIPTTDAPTTDIPTTNTPTTATPTTNKPTTAIPTTSTAISSSTTRSSPMTSSKPISSNPSTLSPTKLPTSGGEGEQKNTVSTELDETRANLGVDNNNNGLSDMVIIIVIVAALVAIIVIVIGLVCCYRIRTKKEPERRNDVELMSVSTVSGSLAVERVSSVSAANSDCDVIEDMNIDIAKVNNMTSNPQRTDTNNNNGEDEEGTDNELYEGNNGYNNDDGNNYTVPMNQYTPQTPGGDSMHNVTPQHASFENDNNNDINNDDMYDMDDDEEDIGMYGKGNDVHNITPFGQNNNNNNNGMGDDEEDEDEDEDEDEYEDGMYRKGNKTQQ